MHKVLIVEDEPIIRKGLIYKFNWPKNNCVVVGSASDGNEGVDKILTLKPDIVITDVRMPFKDGLVMLSETKTKHQFESIIISGYSEFNYAKQAINLGVSNYLLKPINMKELEKTLNKLIMNIDLKKDMKNLRKQSDIYKDVLDIEVNFNNSSIYVKEVMEFIKNNYDKEITTKVISDDLEVSTIFLNNHFKEETNYSVSEFLTRYRIIKALQILQSEKKYIYEVAEMVGFNDYKYFSHVFKSYIGISPKQFLSE